MCVFGMLKTDGRYPFICAHIRDEAWDRETLEIKVDNEGILSANDQNVTNATWMGLNVRTGSFVALTNVRQKKTVPKCDSTEEMRSRGLLVRDLLTGKTYDEVWDGTRNYNGFNLIHYNLKEDNDPRFISNRPHSTKFGLDEHFISSNNFQSSSLSFNKTSNVISFANGWLNDYKQWPRVQVLSEQLRELSKNINSLSVDNAVAVLADSISDSNKFSSEIMPEKYPEYCHAEREQVLRSSLLLPPFSSPGYAKYGSRAQTIVVKDNTGIVYYYYRGVNELENPWTKFVVDYKELNVTRLDVVLETTTPGLKKDTSIVSDGCFT